VPVAFGDARAGGAEERIDFRPIRSRNFPKSAFARVLESIQMRFRQWPRSGTGLKPDVRNAERLAAGVAEGQARQAP